MDTQDLGRNRHSLATSTWFKFSTLARLLLAAVLITSVFFVTADDDLTNDVFQEAEEENSPRAQYTLGLMYLQGRDVPKDKRLALSWLKKSAKQDYTLAQHRLGKLYLSGDIVKANPHVAIKYITLAAEKGYSPAQYLLGTLYQASEQGISKNLDAAATEWLELAADRGHKAAKQALEERNSKHNSGKGQAVANTDAQAAFDKGMQYLKGEGVSRDYHQAVKWFIQAAEQGHADAQYNLGELYNKGHGIKRDKKTAKKWYQAAAKQGHIKAKYRLRGCAYC
jgi:TPR repeat protein